MRTFDDRNLELVHYYSQHVLPVGDGYQLSICDHTGREIYRSPVTCNEESARKYSIHWTLRGA